MKYPKAEIPMDCRKLANSQHKTIWAWTGIFGWYIVWIRVIEIPDIANPINDSVSIRFKLFYVVDIILRQSIISWIIFKSHFALTYVAEYI